MLKVMAAMESFGGLCGTPDVSYMFMTFASISLIHLIQILPSLIFEPNH